MKNIIVTLSGDGGVRLMTATGKGDAVDLPIAMTLSIDGEGEKNQDEEEGKRGGVLTLIHVERSPKLFYRLLVKKSSIKIEDHQQMETALKIVRQGLETVMLQRPKKILVLGEG